MKAIYYSLSTSYADCFGLRNSSRLNITFIAQNVRLDTLIQTMLGRILTSG